jgi:hypothetical protein
VRASAQGSDGAGDVRYEATTCAAHARPSNPLTWDSGTASALLVDWKKASKNLVIWSGDAMLLKSPMKVAVKKRCRSGSWAGAGEEGGELGGTDIGAGWIGG